MPRLVQSENLHEATVADVAVDEVYDEHGHLRQPPSGEKDYKRALTKMGRGLKPRTIGTYTPYLGAFWQLCLTRGAQLEDPALFRGFILAISRHANRKPSASTLRVVCSALAALLGALALRSPLHDPAIKHWLAVEMKTRTRRKPKRSDAILTQQITKALASTDLLIAAGGAFRMRGLRDKALMLLGWTCALRRSELVSVHGCHLRETPTHGWELVIPESKTSTGEDQIIPIVRASSPEMDAICAIAAWVEAGKIHATTPLFRRILRNGSLGESKLYPSTVRNILQQHGMGDEFSPHSLRSGFVTQARLNGAANHQIRVVTRHRSDVMVDLYTRQVDPSRQGPGSLM